MKYKSMSGFIILFFFVALLYSCKKNKDANTPVLPSDSASIATDSALIDSRDFYIWYNQIPSSFNAQSYTDPAAEMLAIRAYSNEPGFGVVDKWSVGILKADWNQLSGGIGSVTTTNANGDFGMRVFFNSNNDLRVKLVERLSPAGLAGIQRGWRITKINGSTNINTNNQDYIINAVSYSGNSTFTFIKPDGSSVDISLTADTYAQQPVYLDTTYTYGSKKIGYMVFNSFLGDTAQIFSDFQRVANSFASKNVTDIVVDLRYNGGGYVSVQEKLADYLAPSSVSGLMMKETFNDKHQDYNTSLYFNKTGPLNLNHIIFIVTQSTASASELLINNLKPVMTVKLIGPDNTDGKPVGFFPLSAGNYYVFPISFRSFNSVNYGGYFNGFTPDSPPVADGLTKNWGDPTESCLASAIKYITTGSFTRQAEEIYKQDPAIIAVNKNLDRIGFKGSVDTRGIK